MQSFILRASIAGTLIAGLGAGLPAAASAQAGDSLAATHAVPWNPPEPIHARHTWERVVLLPGRLLTLPLSGLGELTQRSLLYLEERHLLPLRPLDRASGGPHRVSPYAFQMPALGERTGFGAAVLLRTPTTSDRRPLASLRYAGTIHNFNQTRAMLASGPFDVQYVYDWRPQMQFHGIGPETDRDTDRTNYAWQDEYVRATATLSVPADTAAWQPHATLRVWGGPRSHVTRRGRETGRLSYEERFPELAPGTLNRRFENFAYGANLNLDGRLGRPAWHEGARLRIGVDRYDVPVEFLAIHSGRHGAQFTRFSADLETGFSFWRDPRIFRLRTRVVDNTVGAWSERMQFPDLARLGGREGLSGFAAGRFHDEDLLHARLTYLFPILRFVQMDLHSEVGSVYRDVWTQPRLSTLEHSFGFAIRGRTRNGSHGRVGLDFSREGARVNFTLGGVE